MADTPRTPSNPNVERLSGMPFEKDEVSPLPQFAARQRDPGTVPAEAPLPDTGTAKPNGQEEYPGPQTASTGEHVEPGRQPSSGEATPPKEA